MNDRVNKCVARASVCTQEGAVSDTYGDTPSDTPEAGAGAASQAQDSVRASVLVHGPQAQAFRLFVTHVDAWWQRGPRFRHAGTQAGLIHLEPGVGGRLFESFAAGKHVVEVGRVLLWDAPRALAFSWRNEAFSAGLATRVDVGFAPAPSGTLVTVVHSGWQQVPPDAPARHGLAPTAFLRMMGLWWGEQLNALQQRQGTVAAAAPADAPALLRQATAADVPGIQYVRHAVQENRLSSRLIDDAEVTAYLEQHGRGWVVEAGGQVLAFAVGDRRDGDIWALFVDPEYESRGHGRRLHDTMVQWLFAQGHHRLTLGTQAQSRAQRFYALCGWREISVSSAQGRSGEVQMELLAP